MQHRVNIRSIDKVTHDVLSVVTDKPAQFTFTPGQATEISINKEGWEDETRPFTFTCLPSDDYLEFTIKTYPERKGVTNEFLSLSEGDELIVHDVFGAISYRGEGVFIAGGAGVTPFIAIFRDLDSKDEIDDNKLIFANKTKADIILESELRRILGTNFINILSDEEVAGYAHGRITEDLIETESDGIDKPFYLCGPPPMIDAVEKQLQHLGVDTNDIIKEAL